LEGTIENYDQVEILGKSQLELILKVYDGTIKTYLEAKEAYKKEDTLTGFEKLEKAKRFMTHLYITLDFEQGGEVATNLGKMYVFAINQTCMVQGTKDLEQIDSIVKMLKNIRSGWAELKESEIPGKSVTNEEHKPSLEGFVTSA